MPSRKPFLLRLDPRLHEALRLWAQDEFRSINAHIEYLLRRSLKQAGRPLPEAAEEPAEPDG